MTMQPAASGSIQHSSSSKGKEATSLKKMMVAATPSVVYRDQSHHTDEDKELNELLHKADAEGVKGTDQTFPVKLHQLLSGSDEDGFSHIVSWHPHGRSFIVKKHSDFVDKVLPCCFRQTKFASFQRQLNLYGFRRITQGRDKGGYYHELFLMGRTLLALKMQRTKVKGTGARKPSRPDLEPDFYAMPFVREKESKKKPTALASPTASMPVAAMSPSVAPALQAPLRGEESFLSKFSTTSPSLTTLKPMTDSLAHSSMLGMSASRNITMEASLPSLLAGPADSLSNSTRREIIEQMLATSARMQSLASAGSSSSSHMDYPSLFRGNSIGSLPSDPLGYNSLLAGGSSQHGPLHLNALNMPCTCAIPAF